MPLELRCLSNFASVLLAASTLMFLSSVVIQSWDPNGASSSEPLENGQSAGIHAVNPPERFYQPNVSISQTTLRLMPDRNEIDIRQLVSKETAGNLNFTCDRSSLVVISPEDAEQDRQSCLNMQHGRCLRNIRDQNYGWTCNCGGKVLQYVDISKSGSSTAKRLMGLCGKAPGCHVSYGYKEMTEKTQENVTAFAILRHPIERFISGYGTIMQRLQWYVRMCEKHRDILWPLDSGRLAQIFRMEEPRRFRMFVDFFLDEGDNMIENFPFYYFDCGILPHVMSQTWFMNLYPGRIQYVGKIENATQDISWLIHKVVGVEINAATLVVNKNEGGHMQKFRRLGKDWKTYLLTHERKSIELLNDFFSPELKAFGYSRA
mmetsp:Transcript_8557/g.12088  ORF Transcript_8557/g.12088 Transcript_8557/m.12088 type:complete len:375 (-) Transcript_8557:392-1516(-)|eukprot:CAMPEP_0184489426 /NCGR_PEP_ID=MMETSP0113_2-20130426/15378_1 /TAXON_ID=91329 /ORGANISM="Norrisiella sphaerica, Strain BC52" /LENGTH=374 /DNA_ID=CAMNT_0026872839 /DNA_START=183 /DNA_END=1310 /DNA_ORIENTATION=-